VYYCKNATAEELAKVLQNVPSEKAGAAKGKKAAPVVAGAVKISADKATNSLIIMADKDDYLVLEEVIKKLDIPRSMVYIEALIMEVDMEKSLDIGIDW
ncbi:MAG: type II secretion system protein GspD, partial [Deltaproteobacteria bacterium]